MEWPAAGHFHWLSSDHTQLQHYRPHYKLTQTKFISWSSVACTVPNKGKQPQVLRLKRVMGHPMEVGRSFAALWAAHTLLIIAMWYNFWLATPRVLSTFGYAYIQSYPNEEHTSAWIISWGDWLCFVVDVQTLEEQPWCCWCSGYSRRSPALC